MTTDQNQPSTEDKALTLDPETLADLDPEADANEVQGGGKICTGRLTSC